MVTLIESFLKNLSTETITNVFFWVLISVFTISLLIFILPLKCVEKKKSLTEYAPNLLTSLGILGTFTGIVSGLLNFDITAIDSSISQLLGGMKTAFLTSVIGVGLSILLKLIYAILTKKKRTEGSHLDIEAVVDNFYQQTEELKGLNKHVENLVNSIGGDAESSLTSQVKLMRSDISDQQKMQKSLLNDISQYNSELVLSVKKQQDGFGQFTDKLWIKLQDFADMMSKSATEAVIDALKQVIQDFNNNLTEQFGENFKQLNAAVKKLVDWQEKYKQQLNEMITLYNTGVATLASTEAAVSSIENSTRSIPVTMENLDSILKVNQHQIGNLEQHLASFAVLRDKAVAALPEVQQQIDLVLSNVVSGNEKLQTGLASGAEKLTETITNSAQKLAREYADVGQSFSQKLEQSSQQFVKDVNQYHQLLTENSKLLVNGNQEIKLQLESAANIIKEQFARQVEEHKHFISRLETESENALSRTGESINKQIKALDEALETELKRVMTDMGRALASISDRFTQDYTQLVNEMRKIVEQGNRGRY